MDLAGKRAIEMHVDEAPVSPLNPLDVSTGSRDDTIEHPERAHQQEDPAATTTTTTPPSAPAGTTTPTMVEATTDGGRDDTPTATTEAAAFDEDAPIVYSESTTETYTTEYEDYTLIQEKTTVTEVNSLDQTRTTTTSTSHTKPKQPEARSATPPTT
jgi:hypothetical protein